MRTLMLAAVVLVSCGPKQAGNPAPVPIVQGWVCFDAENNGGDYSFCYRSTGECMDGIALQRPAGFQSVTGCAPATTAAWCVTYIPAGSQLAIFFCSRSEQECSSDYAGVIGKDASILQACTRAD